MAEPTVKQLENMFERHKRSEITFNREVIDTTGLQPKKLSIRYGDTQKACSLHSVSLTTAKIMATMSPLDLEAITNSDTVFLSFSFGRSKLSSEEVSFLAAYRVARMNPVMKIDADRYLVSLESSTVPPNDLIRILGGFLDYQVERTKRREPRIMIDSHSAEVIGLKLGASTITIDGEKKSCVVLDLSVSGAKALLWAESKATPREAILTLSMVGPEEVIEIPCTILRYDTGIEEGTVTLGIAYKRDSILPAYRARVERQLEKMGIEAEDEAAPKKKAKRRGISSRAHERQEMREQIKKMISMLETQKLWKLDAAALKRTLEGLKVLMKSLDS
jgi:hypothetical protein